MFKEFNLCDNVKIKLNEVGKDILRNNWKKTCESSPDSFKLEDFKLPEEDKDGYVTYQTFQLITIFGQDFITGNPPFGSNVLIDIQE